MFSADPHCFVVLQGECIFAIQGCTRLDQERRIRRHDPSPIFWKNGYVFSGKALVRKRRIYAANIEP
jgi:hypothetical protein